MGVGKELGELYICVLKNNYEPYDTHVNSRFFMIFTRSRYGAGTSTVMLPREW